MCEALGRAPYSFEKKDGTPYVEAHHVEPVSSRTQGVLRPENIITVCADHHRQLHYGKAQLLDDTAEAFVFRVDETDITVSKNHLE